MLVQLDQEPYQVDRRSKAGGARRRQVESDRGGRSGPGRRSAQARAARFKLEHAIEDVNNQIAVVAGQCGRGCKRTKAKLALAQADYQTSRRIAENSRRHQPAGCRSRGRPPCGTAEASAAANDPAGVSNSREPGLADAARRGARSGRSAAESGSNIFVGAGRMFEIVASRRPAGGRSIVVRSDAQGSDRRVLQARARPATSTRFTTNSSKMRPASNMPSRK